MPIKHTRNEQLPVATLCYDQQLRVHWQNWQPAAENQPDTGGVELLPATNSHVMDSYSNLKHMANGSAEERFNALLEAIYNAVQLHNSHIKHDTIPKDCLFANPDWIDYILSIIEARIANQLDAILHHRQWRAIESAWRGLEYLLEQAHGHTQVMLEILDASKQDWEDDFDQSPWDQSNLHKIIYQYAYDMPGAFPYSALISAYTFDHLQPDLNLLENLAQVAMAAHCPLLANSDHAFFKKNNAMEISSIQDMQGYLQQTDYLAWQAFREKDCARYVGLALPRFLLRQPYGCNLRTKCFNYNEHISPKHSENHLWGPASIALASNMIRSFIQHGWTLHIRGPQSGGKVSGLPIIHYGCNEIQPPVEMLIPESKEVQLATAGFIPMSYYAGTEFACFFSANSAHKAKIYASDIATCNSRINARLPYILLTSRIAHYIKVLQREVIGMQCAAMQLEKDINHWLQSLVTKMNNPDMQLAARYPLQHAAIKVHEHSDNPGYFKVELSMVPHFQVEGLDVHLFLVSKLPNGKNKH